MELDIKENELSILRKELSDFHQRRRRDNYTPNSHIRGASNNYCSPVRGPNDFDNMSNEKLNPRFRATTAQDIPSNNSVNLSPFTGGGGHSALKVNQRHVGNDRLLQEKERVIESMNKEIISLKLKVEELINGNGPSSNNDREFEEIRRNILIEMSEMLFRINQDMKQMKEELSGNAQPEPSKMNMVPKSYTHIQLTEDAFLNEISHNLNDLEDLVHQSDELVMLASADHLNKTPN